MEKNDVQGGLFVESPDLPKENNNGRHAMEKEKNSTPQKHEEIITCCFCGKKIRRIHGNNPWPVIDADDVNVGCCPKCDASIVLPARMKLMYGANTSHSEQTGKEIHE